MGNQLWLPDVVSDAFRGVKGYKVEVLNGWNTRGRTNFAPIGVMNHHTGGGSYGALLNYMAWGSSIAPLCNIATSRPQNGVVRITIVEAGRANHAGLGHLSWTGTNNGNYRTIGIENQNDGSEPWPDQQVEGIHILSAALLEKLDVGTTRLVDHKTYAPSRKVDRHSTNLNYTRSEVDKILKSEPQDEWEVFWMSLTNEEKERLKEFASELAGADGTRGHHFARELLKDHRERIPALQEFRDNIDRLVGVAETTLQGVIVGGVNAIDAVRDLGYKISANERTGATKE